MTITVPHYGIHKTLEGVVYLHQGGDKSANFIRLKERSPYVVHTGSKRMSCPHMISVDAPMPDREHWSRFMDIYSDPLTLEFLPLPKDPFDAIPFVADVEDLLLVALSRMSSPILPTVIRFDQFNSWSAQSLFSTNVGPVVLTHIKTSDQASMESLVTIARRAPRKLILAGEKSMVVASPSMRRVTTLLHSYPSVDLYSLPMENLGAVAMRRWARGEQINAPWERSYV